MKSGKKYDGFISFLILAVYVDDIISVSNDVAKSATEAEFEAMSSNTRSNPHMKTRTVLGYKADLPTVLY